MIAFERKLRLDYVAGRTWVLVEPIWFVYEDEWESYDGHIPAGFVTDFNSVPRPFWSVLPPADFGQAALIHDFAYRTQALSRRGSDRAFLEALEQLGAPVWKREAMYLAVRMFGGSAYGKQREAAV